ncbi:uncharacterized protein LACBIDRAFT_291817 [Laccaria bicolor S238N-H82]|uniref:Predicted protein n=1 Tax=Laccaria bicolor (strain S238N-H82 / ATCC MYA-4686) TaxID=486041 RepID=B0CNR7_LACBS|nr:uncharacterized protein LACBIDRAFT_291817 [Laccaria bicolor S238N-H82]EDR15345.1 predicted protein [Laccaria bicolor S238N-H82]|eukprot:XP_001873553.1 predicted protein [Laccaria bicolor S238N-H82]
MSEPASAALHEHQIPEGDDDVVNGHYEEEEEEEEEGGEEGVELGDGEVDEGEESDEYDVDFEEEAQIVGDEDDDEEEEVQSGSMTALLLGNPNFEEEEEEEEDEEDNWHEDPPQAPTASSSKKRGIEETEEEDGNKTKKVPPLAGLGSPYPDTTINARVNVNQGKPDPFIFTHFLSFHFEMHRIKKRVSRLSKQKSTGSRKNLARA